jgi:hypothetical protein
MTIVQLTCLFESFDYLGHSGLTYWKIMSILVVHSSSMKRSLSNAYLVLLIHPLQFLRLID